jgi:hypothetical protein
MIDDWNPTAGVESAINNHKSSIPHGVVLLRDLRGLSFANFAVKSFRRQEPPSPQKGLKNSNQQSAIINQQSSPFRYNLNQGAPHPHVHGAGC